VTWSFSIGRLFGSDLRVHATFFLLILWIGAAAWVQGGAPAAIDNIVFILAVFLCVVAHEFGHALMARRYGIATPDITLLPIGGLARLERMPERPSQEIAVAVAGPAVNVVIWVGLVLLGAETDMARLLEVENTAAGFLGRLAAVNLFLVAFNMIPAFPMDGGRVLRALLAMRMGRARATRMAAGAGQVLAFGFGLLGLMSGNPVLLLIAVFVFVAASSESADVALRDVARGLRARDAMITQFERLDEDASLDTAARTLIRTTQHEFPVTDEAGRLVGFLTRAALYSALASEDRRSAPIAPLLLRNIPCVQLRSSLLSALDAMQRAGTPAVGVTGPDGLLLGYITPENLGELMVVWGKSE